MTAVLSAHRITKSYGVVPVLKSVDLVVEPGETLGIIGPNGAGKSTLFKCLSGEVQVDNGSIHHEGRNVTFAPAHDRAKVGFGRTFQVARIFPNFTVRENITVAVEARLRNAGQLRSSWRSAPGESAVGEVDAVLRELKLEPKADMLGRYLSHGDRKQLELALVVAMRARILMLDEPTAGMSPADRLATVDLVKRLRKTFALTVLITEHDMGVIFGLADRIMVLNYGETVAMGTPEEIKNDARVRQIYLGRDALRA